MFTTVLIANRGEIAVRVQRTLRRLGVRSVAVYAPDDAGSVHVREADEAVRIPSYLDGAAIIEAARATSAQAVHPGYGFLAENAAFARACAEAGVVFIGPPPSAIDAMGDKIEAKLTVAAAGVPVVPGRDERGLSDEQIAEAALEIGLPVLLKPSAGGGGKGMRLVRAEEELAGAIASARREARGAFGDDTLLAERFIDGPRHIEVQVFADAHGNVVHLGERECSLQRRHQKIVEEAPSPLLDAAQRAEIGAHAVNAARSIGYVGAGTVEFIVAGERPDERYFMEMNTRLQVEHPVTELVTGLDLVELQLRVASGEPLPFTQDDVVLTGHAVEARVYAEDPARGFLPTGGRVLALAEPAQARVDSGIGAGDEIGSRYDPMIAKVVVHGRDRAEALRALDRALAEYSLLGVHTNVAFLRRLLARPEVVSGELDTGLVERVLPELNAGDATVPEWVLAAAALERMRADAPAGDGPWDAMDGWRVGEAAWTPHALVVDGGEPVEARTRGEEVAVGDGPPRHAVLSGEALVLDGRRHPHRRATGHDGAVWIGADGRTWSVRERERLAAGGASAVAGGVLRSPMPGTVLAVKVAEGDAVAEGQPVVIVEAMKMEHTVVAAVAGTVARLPVRVGDQVALDAVLAEITSEEAE
ncbi:acetyl/propionyl/methylcrotonyl-CoA carboxylase subunit alpha [Actinocorallia populi]|uniref:acetyl/propionyl/methylcrotonyl-CoA carboxylase subunit alpha n=1 Tax=Actinocorallia populi TaxID=2079200 RepID=UPI0018E507E4|nr:biotin carboxylase N-terminal domain-containing protein [Actinocorallia populi]